LNLLILEIYHVVNTASLDRIDSSKGYESGNIQWVHKQLNNMKQALPENEFFEWIKLVHSFKDLARNHH